MYFFVNMLITSLVEYIVCRLQFFTLFHPTELSLESLMEEAGGQGSSDRGGELGLCCRESCSLGHMCREGRQLITIVLTQGGELWGLRTDI